MPAPTTTEVIDGLGHQTGSSVFKYKIAWVDQYGNTTAPSPDVTNTAPTGSQNATRILLPTAPSGVSADQHLPEQRRQHRQPLVPGRRCRETLTYYDDWQSQGDFAGTLGALAPAYNSTAGGFIDSGGNQIAFLGAPGINLPGSNARFKLGVGWQFFNPTTSLWHTLLCTGNPPQLAVDAGSL